MIVVKMDDVKVKVIKLVELILEVIGSLVVIEEVVLIGLMFFVLELVGIEEILVVIVDVRLFVMEGNVFIGVVLILVGIIGVVVF